MPKKWPNGRQFFNFFDDYWTKIKFNFFSPSRDPKESQIQFLADFDRKSRRFLISATKFSKIGFLWYDFAVFWVQKTQNNG